MSQDKIIFEDPKSNEESLKIDEQDIILHKLNVTATPEKTNAFCTVLSSDPIPIADSHVSTSHDNGNQSTYFIDESDKLSSSFCDSESVASMSHSICDELESKKSKRKKKKKKIKDCQDEADKEIYTRPNYFVGVQISNPEIHRAVADVQKDLLSFNKNVMPALIDVATLHITLLVAHIANEEELHVACSALDHCGADLSESLSNPPLCIKFREISHFSNQTVFAKVIEDENYQRFLLAAETIRNKFEEMGINMPDKRSFTPHLTIAKLSKVPRGKGKESVRKIEPSSYASSLNKNFGEQIITGLQLLSMNKPKTENRYYPIVRETLFDFTPKESADHSQCCFPRQPVTPKLHRRLHTSTKPSEAHSSLSDVPSSNKSVPDLPNFNSSVSELPNSNSSVPDLPISNSSVPDLSNSNSPISELPNSNSSVPDLPNSNSSVSDLPNSNSSVPDLPNSNSSVPDLPNSNSSVPDLPNSNSSVPDLPNSNSSVPDLPNSNSSVPDLPNSNSSVPDLPNSNSSVPDLPNSNSSVPDLPNSNSSVPDLPNSNSSVPDLSNSNSSVPDLRNFNSSLPAPPNSYSNLPEVPNAVRSYRPLALTVIGGLGLLSFGFALSRWMRRR